VSDTGNDRFTILEPDGTYIETWGAGGSADGEFRLRRDNGDGYGGIEFAPDGSFYVLDVGNRRVQHFGPDREFLGAWGSSGNGPGQYLDPIWLDIAADGTVIVLECGRDVVEFYDADGTVIRSIDPHPDGEGGFNCANSMVTDEAGNVYIASCCGSGNFLAKFAPDGTLLWTADSGGDGKPFGEQPTGIAVDQEGNVFMGHGLGLIHVFDAHGAHVAQWDGSENGGPAFELPTSLVLDGAGTMYVTDHFANVLRAFRLTPTLGS
jgi:tripartite motif-containing protein 71